MEVGEAALCVQEALGHVAARRSDESSNQEAGFKYTTHNKRAYNKSQRGELCPSLSTLRTRLAVFSVHLQIARVTHYRDANLDLHVSFHTFELTVLVLVTPSMRREHGRPHLRSRRSSWRISGPCSLQCTNVRSAQIKRALTMLDKHGRV